MKGRKGYYILDMLVATLIVLLVLHSLFHLHRNANIVLTQEHVVRDLTYVGNMVREYVDANIDQLLNTNATPELSYGEGQDTKIFAPTLNQLDEMFAEYVPVGTTFSDLRTVQDDTYRVIFERSTESGSALDRLSAYVVAVKGTKSRKNTTPGTVEGDYWLGQGMRQTVLRAGSRFGYVENGTLKNQDWEITEGLSTIHAQNGDLGYMAAYHVTDISIYALSRYATGDNEDNTMRADLAMEDHNILNVQYSEIQALEASNIRFDPSLYPTAEDAESSCQNGWMFIRDKNGRKKYVDADGHVYESFTGSNGAYTGSGNYTTLGMNGGAKAPRVVPNKTTRLRKLDMTGRIYFIAPSKAKIPGSSTTYTDSERTVTNEIFAQKTQLAVCRKIHGKNSLAYIGDNRSEDKVSFVVSAVDGDFIPPFFCPGQDASVAGGGENSLRTKYSGKHVTSSGDFGTSFESETLFSSGKNTSDTTKGIMPRLFVMPQFVMTGSVTYPIQGIRAWAETVNPDDTMAGWIIRINALVDTQQGASNTRTYWIGNYPTKPNSQPSDTPTETSAGYMTESALEKLNNPKHTNTQAHYTPFLRAVVIGVCSGKLATF